MIVGLKKLGSRHGACTPVWDKGTSPPTPAPARSLPPEPTKKVQEGDRPVLLALRAVVEYLVERFDGKAVKAVLKAPCAVPATDHVFRYQYGTI